MSQGFTKDIAINTDGTLSANSDFLVPSQKAVKTYVDTADALKANLASPTFTGNPSAPTPTAGDNDTTIATTAFTTTAVNNSGAYIFLSINFN